MTQSINASPAHPRSAQICYLQAIPCHPILNPLSGPHCEVGQKIRVMAAPLCAIQLVAAYRVYSCVDIDRTQTPAAPILAALEQLFQSIPQPPPHVCMHASVCARMPALCMHAGLCGKCSRACAQTEVQECVSLRVPAREVHIGKRVCKNSGVCACMHALCMHASMCGEGRRSFFK